MPQSPQPPRSQGPSQQLCQQLMGEDVMVAFGEALGRACQGEKAVVFLQGDLGMGKTTLSRGVLQSFGHQGPVKSPTYTLVEPYQFDSASVYHFDLYRLGDPEELEYIGIRDYFEEDNSLCLLEWADKGGMFLPRADLIVRITAVVDGREVTVTANSASGLKMLSALSAILSNE